MKPGKTLCASGAEPEIQRCKIEFSIILLYLFNYKNSLWHFLIIFLWMLQKKNPGGWSNSSYLHIKLKSNVDWVFIQLYHLNMYFFCKDLPCAITLKLTMVSLSICDAVYLYKKLSVYVQYGHRQTDGYITYANVTIKTRFLCLEAWLDRFQLNGVSTLFWSEVKWGHFAVFLVNKGMATPKNTAVSYKGSNCFFFLVCFFPPIVFYRFYFALVFLPGAYKLQCF